MLYILLSLRSSNQELFLQENIVYSYVNDVSDLVRMMNFTVNVAKPNASIFLASVMESENWRMVWAPGGVVNPSMLI